MCPGTYARRVSILRVGLTGGIACGKSVVATRLGELGALIIDADVLAREVVAPGTPGLAAIVRRFGSGIIADDGSLDRARLGEVVFADDQARADLNAIVHPAVRARARHEAATAPDGSVVVLVIPLLVETGQQDDFDILVVVDVPVETQLARLIARSHLTRQQAQARIDAQANRQQRLAVADVVIDNSGPLAATMHQVEQLWHTLVMLRPQTPLREQGGLGSSGGWA